jgi:bifunctional non-homologous end joining protein LigD
MHQHGARRLHFDLRMEFDGVLVSWAVPKGPSLDPAEKRMAVLVEDHPLGYADFEGVIPAGNYGAGPMILWDRGVWIALEDPAEGIEKGKLLFELKGYKLRGVWTLVRTKGPKGNEWLLIKKPDGAAALEGTKPFAPESVLSGLTLEELRDGAKKSEEVTRKLEELRAPKKAIDPRGIELMLAETAEKPFSDPRWLFELKYDGFRLLASKEAGEVLLRYRSGIDATHVFPEVKRSLGAWPFERVVLDGEVVVLDDDARPSFNRLQQRVQLIRDTDIGRAMIAQPATYYAFDLLAFEGYDVRPLPLEARKELLSRIAPAAGPIRYSDHIEEKGEALYEQVKNLGVEGVIAKERTSPYRSGRSKSWLKIRTEQSADFVVVGFTKPKATRTGFGALHLAIFESEGGPLVYAGRAGTGYDEATLELVRATLDPIVRSKPPCEGPVPTGRDHVWVEPKLIAEVRYLEWTPDGLVRHPVFVRLRDDKRIEECLRASKVGPKPVPQAEREPPPPPPPGARSPVTNAEKVFWPEDGITKGDLYSYYLAVSPFLIPYLRERPVVVVRYPDGIEGKSFFQKDAPGYVPSWMRTERMWSEQAAKEIDHFIAGDADSLLYLVNLGTIPLHVWASRVTNLGRPDWCVLDLDPKGAPFSDVVKIARAIHALCGEIELPCYPKTSGSSGLHVMIPVGGQLTFDQSRSLGELLARVIAEELPEISTVARQVSARGGKVYLDYLQNGHGKLIVSPLCVRPLAGAPVSMPLRWIDVDAKLDPSRFTVKTAVARLEKLGDPMLPLLSDKPDLARALERLGARLTNRDRKS